MNKWYIYALREPIGQKIRYVGYTSDPAGRLLRHLSFGKAASTYLQRWIRKLQRDGQNPTMEILENGSGHDWAIRERYWIRYFRASGADLVNCTQGGDAGFKFPFSAQHCRRISEAKIGVKRPDNAARNRALALSLRGKKLKLTKAERYRRRLRGLAAVSNLVPGLATKTALQRSRIVRKAWITRKRNHAKRS